MVRKYIAALEEIRAEAWKKLKKSFDLKYYLIVLETTALISQVFARRRPGDHQYTTYESYRTGRETVDKDPYFKNIYQLDKEFCRKFFIFRTSAKKGSTSELVLTKRDVEFVDYLIENRPKAGVHEDNPYLWALPGAMKENPTLNMSLVQRTYSIRIFGKKKAKLLRSRELRQHFATEVEFTYKGKKADASARALSHSKPMDRNFYQKNSKSYLILQSA